MGKLFLGKILKKKEEKMDWIKFSEQSKKFLSRCDSNLFKHMKKKIDLLKENPVTNDNKRLKSYKRPTFKIRVGKYRVLYEVNYNEKVILVAKIEKRGRVYN